MSNHIHIIGGGLAGTEAAWQVARRGISCTLYEMRFDEVSAVYALFGSFFVGVRTPVANLADLLAA